MFNQGNRDQTCQNCWRQLPFGFKFLFIVTLAYNFLSMIFTFLIGSVYFNGFLVVKGFQVWRLLIPFFPAGIMPFSIFNILINFLWLLSIYPPMEKKLSSSFIIIETFLQNLLLNFVLSLLSFIGFYIFSINAQQYPIINYGLFPLCMIFIWQQAAQNPEQHTTFCCMPCLIKMKWIPLIILAFCLFMASNLFVPLLVACTLGYLQFMHFKRRIFKLPLKFYRKIDSILPNSNTNRPDYVKVQNVERDLRQECTSSGVSMSDNQNPFNRNQNRGDEISEAGNKVQVMGKGVSIGGGSSNVQSFKGFWAKKGQQLEVEPVPSQMIAQQRQNKQNFNDNYVAFANESHLQLNQISPAEKSEEQFGEKDERKQAKQNLLL